MNLGVEEKTGFEEKDVFELKLHTVWKIGDTSTRMFLSFTCWMQAGREKREQHVLAAAETEVLCVHLTRNVRGVKPGSLHTIAE